MGNCFQYYNRYNGFLPDTLCIQVEIGIYLKMAFGSGGVKPQSTSIDMTFDGRRL